MGKNQEIPWTLVVTPKRNWFSLNLPQIWRYRDLLILFLRRDIVTVYKQTILGPLWFVIQPVLTTIIFTIIFGNIAKISTDGLPPILFYLSGIILWNYFAECVRTTSDSFKKNEKIFGKVYFPRVIVPMATVLANLLKFGIQFMLFIAVFLYYYYSNEINLQWNWSILLFPLLIFISAGLSLGTGMIVSSLTTKYRDLSFLISFGIQLIMYATPVIYPLSEAPEKYRSIILINPMSGVIESFRTIFLGTSQLEFTHLFYSLGCTFLIILIGLVVFNRVEKSFMDTV